MGEGENSKPMCLHIHMYIHMPKSEIDPYTKHKKPHTWGFVRLAYRIKGRKVPR